MVLLGRIELPTSPLPRVCSTTELQQRLWEAARLRHGGGLVKQERLRQAVEMAANDDKATREERLAAKLRENLRRRKAQARALDGKPSDAVGLSKGEDDS